MRSDDLMNAGDGRNSLNPEVKVDIDKDFRKDIKTTSEKNPIPADWFGNTPLHHAFAEDKVNIELVKNIIYNHPEYCRVKNQFGKLPIHYAVDRIRANAIWNAAGIRLLILAYPEGVNELDSENQNVYDIAVKWEHSNALKLMILQVNPSLDLETYVKLKFWPFGHAYLAVTQCLATTRGTCDCPCCGCARIRTDESDSSGMMNGNSESSPNNKSPKDDGSSSSSGQQYVAIATAPASVAVSTSATTTAHSNRVVPFHSTNSDDELDEKVDE